MKKSFNYYLFFLTIFLLVFGLLFLSSISSSMSLQRFGTTNYYFFHQLLYGLLPALICGVIAYKLPLHYIKKISPILLLLNLIVLALVFLPFLGAKFWGAQRWLNIGGIITQPSEALKITSILYLSAWIGSKLSEETAMSWKSRAEKGYHNLIYVLIPFIIFLAVISIILIFQPDLTTLGIIGLTLAAVYFSAKTPLWHTVSIAAGAAGALFLLVKFSSYRWDRWLVFLQPDSDPLGKGFQLNQSLIALGSGGFWGRGLGMSIQKFGFLPSSMSDSVFAVLGEETGIVGCAILIALFVLFFWLGMQIVKKSNDRFSKLCATGIVFWITLQAFVNIGSVVGVFPVSGVPLPFFSYGGSHLVTELIGVGILLNVSKNS